MLVLSIFAGSMMSRNSIAQLQHCSTCFARCLPREEAAFYPLKSAVLAMHGRGKRANSTAKTIIYNVYQYFQKETAKNKYRGALKLMGRTAEETGYSERTVRRTVTENTELEGTAFTSPPKRYRRERKRIDHDQFDTQALRRTVHEFYREKKYPTLDMLPVAIREKSIFSGERTTLWKILRKMGFKHKKVNDKRYINEQARIIVQRHKYLRRLRRNRREHKPVVYLDET